MKRVRVREAFTGYPEDRRRDFVAGEVAEVDDAFADLIIGKGHAELAGADATAPESEPKKRGARR